MSCKLLRFIRRPNKSAVLIIAKIPISDWIVMKWNACRIVLLSKVNQSKVQKACFIMLHSAGKNVFSGGEGDCLWILQNLKIRYIQRMNERGLTWFLPTSGFGADQSIPEKYCHSGREVLGTKLPYSSNILSQYWNNGPIENSVRYCH